MAGSKSDYLENKVLDHVLGGGDYTRPATVYVALYTAAPSDSGGGTEVSTGTWTNYARTAVTNNATNFPAASSGLKGNGTAISMGTATMSPTNSTVVVVAFGILDASTSGNLLFWGDLTTSKTINHNDPVSFAINAIQITET